MNKMEREIDFLALGEAVVDLISSGIVSSLKDANSFQRFLGGEVTNLAINMAKLGNTAALGTCLGDDGFGDYLRNGIREAGVLEHWIQHTALAPSTIITVARQTQTPDFIIYRGADALLRLTPALEQAVDLSRSVHTSAFALSRNPARDTILSLIKHAHQEGKLVSFDPNYHPRLHPDRQDYLAILKETFSYVQVTKPSLDDGTRLFGPGYSPMDYVKMYLDLGARLVVLTMGGDGVILASSQGECCKLEPNPISVVDVTGAGDAFWSGLLSGLLSGSSPLEAARLGQAVAEFKIGMVGPVVEFPDKKTLNEKALTIRVSPLVYN